MPNLLRQLLNDVTALTEATRPDGTRGVDRWVRELTSDGFQVLLLQRLRERARRFHVPLVNHVMRRATTMVFGLEIGNHVTLGDGVSFVHPVAIVIGGDSKIGARVRFYGNNTIGTAKDNGYPVIEEDVTIGAGARVLGPIRVGRGAIIGANAVVLHDVPAGAVVTGVPGVVRVRSGHIRSV